MMWSLYLWTILSLTWVQSAPIEDIGELSLDLLPPFENIRDSRQLTDSYGQIIPSPYIKAESTPEGRKIAKTDDGIQFEIPTYASGIIDDRKNKEDVPSASISTSVINNPQSQIPLNVIIPKIEPHIHNSNIEFEIVKSMEIELKDIEPKVDHKRQSDEAHGSGIRAPVGIFDEQKQVFTHYRRQDHARKLKFDTPHNDLLPPINKDIENTDDSESSQFLNENTSLVSSTVPSSVLPEDQSQQSRTTKKPNFIKENNEPHLELELLPPSLDNESSHLNLTNNEENSLDRKINIPLPQTELEATAENQDNPENNPVIENPTLEILPPILPESTHQDLNKKNVPESNNSYEIKFSHNTKNYEHSVAESPVTDLLPPHEMSSTIDSTETTTTTQMTEIIENVQANTEQPDIKIKVNHQDSVEGKLKSYQNQSYNKNITPDNAPSIDLLPPHLEINIEQSSQPQQAEKNKKTQSLTKNSDKAKDISQNTTPVTNNKLKPLPAKEDTSELILELLPPLMDGESVDSKIKPLLLINAINNITNNTIKEINQLSLDLLPPIKTDNNSASTNSINNKIRTEKPLIPEVPRSVEKSLWQGDIYKGGFGGPSGFLGKQIEVGSFYNNLNQDLTTTAAVPNPEDIYKGGFGGPSGVLGEQTTTEAVPNPEDIYKGGFGGPSGVLGEQKEVGTYHKNVSDDVTTTETVPNPEDIYKGGFGGPSGVLGEQTTTEAVPNLEDIYKGGFGGPSGVLGEQKDVGTYHKNVSDDATKTEAVPNPEDIYKGGFGGPSGFLGEQKDVGTYHKNLNHDAITTEAAPNPEDIYKGGFGGPTGFLGEQKDIGSFYKTKTETSAGIVKTAPRNLKGDYYEGDIYKGGFGGPSGFLGQQKDIGSFHKAQITTTNSPIALATTSAGIQDIQKSNNPFISNINANTGILGEEKLIGIHSNKIQVKSKEKNIIGTTTPPTSLLSVSTILASTNKIINKTTSTAFPAINFSPTFSDTSGAIAPPSRLFQPPFLDSPNPKSNFKINVPNNNFSEQPSTAFAERLNFDKQKETGVNDFRFPIENPATNTFNTQLPTNVNIPFANTPLLSPVLSQKPIPIAPANTFPQNLGQKPTIAAHSTNNINFGGAPGILGNQKPGYAVRPDGTIKDPDHEYKKPGTAAVITKPVAIQKPVIPAQPSNNINKYNGGFGGAPGILTPFDNGK